MLDALSLARCLYASSCKEQSDVMIALSNYHQEMIERSTKKVQASAQAAQFLHTQVAIQKGNITRGAAASTTATTTSQQGIEK